MNYAPFQDRKGNDLHPGDRVRFKLYPRGKGEGVVVISPRVREVLPDGSTAPALAIIDSGGTLYGIPSPKGVLKIRKRKAHPKAHARLKRLRSYILRKRGT